MLQAAPLVAEAPRGSCPRAGCQRRWVAGARCAQAGTPSGSGSDVPCRDSGRAGDPSPDPGPYHALRHVRGPHSHPWMEVWGHVTQDRVDGPSSTGQSKAGTKLTYLSGPLAGNLPVIRSQTVRGADARQLVAELQPPKSRSPEEADTRNLALAPGDNCSCCRCCGYATWLPSCCISWSPKRQHCNSRLACLSFSRRLQTTLTVRVCGPSVSQQERVRTSCRQRSAGRHTVIRLLLVSLNDSNVV